MLRIRFASGLMMVAAVIAVLGLDEKLKLGPWYPFWLAAAAAVYGLAALELFELLKRTGARPSGNTMLGGVLAMIAANWAPHLTDHLAKGSEKSHAAVSAIFQSADSWQYRGYDASAPIAVLAWPLCAFVGVLMFSFIVQSIQFRQPGETTATVAGSILAIAYIGILGGFILQFRWLPHGVVALTLLITTCKGSDIGAFTFGRLFGKHKLWPRISPNKTVEGAAGGLIFAAIASILVVEIGRRVFGIQTLDPPAALGYGLLIGAFAQLGDLMESMIKRDCESKDASAAVPGYGGVLDILDSLLFAAPVAYGYWIYHVHSAVYAVG